MTTIFACYKVYTQTSKSNVNRTFTLSCSLYYFDDCNKRVCCCWFI